MMQPTQAEIIEAALMAVSADPKVTTCKEAYDVVCDKLQVPRPTVRRVKKALVEKLHNVLEVLEG